MEKEMKVYKIEITLNSKIEYYVKASSKEAADKFVDCCLFGDTDTGNEIETILDENSHINSEIKEIDQNENHYIDYSEGIDFDEDGYEIYDSDDEDEDDDYDDEDDDY